jgi:DNA-binding NtrC family response regulator
MIFSWQPDQERQTIIKEVKILVVDDDIAIKNFTVNALTYCVNREVISFGDGLSAWRYIENGGQADMIISDVDMPKMNGFELLEKVRKNQANTVFILMSGHAENEGRAMASNADAFLAKPFAINDLFNIVQTYIVS